MADTAPVITKAYVPLTCHGHSRPVTHISFGVSRNSTSEDILLVSACKDNNPMLRDGTTGDWIGTFFGHKGAVYQTRLSPTASIAASASADFTARVWDTHTGETLLILEHDHIVRAVAFPHVSDNRLATGGMEKKLRIFNIESIVPGDHTNGNITNGDTVLKAKSGQEIGAGVHQGTIKSIVWTQNPDVLVTVADDKVIRWFDIKTGTVIQEKLVQGEIGSCEFSSILPTPNDAGRGLPVLTVAAGNSVYFYGGLDARELLKQVDFPYPVASAAIHPFQRKFVTGALKDTWARVYDYETEQEIDFHKGHHGPIWSISFSPDGNLYATGSEDGTIKMWKNCQGEYGLWK